jgi:hypothetical protein
MASLSLCISGFVMFGIQAILRNGNTFIEGDLLNQIHFVDSTESSCFTTQERTYSVYVAFRTRESVSNSYEAAPAVYLQTLFLVGQSERPFVFIKTERGRQCDEKCFWKTKKGSKSNKIMRLTPLNFAALIHLLLGIEDFF